MTNEAEANAVREVTEANVTDKAVEADQPDETT